jgi:hypothetical protein
MSAVAILMSEVRKAGTDPAKHLRFVPHLADRFHGPAQLAGRRRRAKAVARLVDVANRCSPAIGWAQVDRELVEVGEVFPLMLPPRVGHGFLREHLASRHSNRLELVTSGFTLEDLAGAGFDRTVEEIVAAQQVAPFEWGEPEVDLDQRSTRTYPCDDPMCAGARRPGAEHRHSHTDTMLHLTVAVTAGDTSLLQYWPSGSHHPLDQEFVSCTRDAITVRFHTGKRGAEMARQIVADLIGLLQAANADIAAHYASLRERVRALLERRLAELRREGETIEATGFSTRSRREAPVEYRIPDQKRDVPAQVPVPFTETAEVGFQLSRADFEAVLQCISSWANSAERHAGVASGGGEDELRNSLLATLAARFVDGSGEAFSVLGKTDLRVLVRTALGGLGPQVFHAECKIWKGPASVDQAFTQLVERYSTHRDRLGALVFFIVDRVNPQEVAPTIVRHLCDSHAATEVEPISGWRVVSVPDPMHDGSWLELAVVAIDVQRFRSVRVS